MKRTQAHVTGDQGLIRVMKLCIDVGWAVDRVMSDYGEDLIIQTSHQCIVDPFRVLVQVKTTSRRLSSTTKLSCRVSRQHALRWAHNAEPVVFVLWHKPSERGWYLLPREHMNECQLLLSEARSIELPFQQEDELTSASLGKLAWSLRLDYFKQQMLAAVRSDQDEMNARSDGYGSPNYQSRMPAIILSLFRLLQIARPDGLSSQVVREFTGIRRRVKDKERDLPRSERSSPEQLDHMAAILCILVRVERLTGIATPTPVAEYASDALLRVLKSPLVPRLA